MLNKDSYQIICWRYVYAKLLSSFYDVTIRF